MSKLPTKKQIKHKRIVLSIIAAIAVIFVFLFYITITRSGHWLVSDDDVNHVTWIVIMDGQSADMERSDYAAEWLAAGKADSVIILGRRNFRNRSNAEFYLDDFMKLGDFDSNAVFIAQHDDPSSISEAYTVIPWLKKHKADTVLLLTGASSSKRVKTIFTTLSGETPVYVTKDIHHFRYSPDSWYSNRETRKEWLRGWTAMFSAYFDLLDAGNLTAQDSFYYKPIVSAREFEAQKNPMVDLQSLLPQVQKSLEKASADTTSKDSTIKDSTLKNPVVKDSTVKDSSVKASAKKDTAKAKP